MSHATELIKQIIRKQNLHMIYPGQEESAFGDLVQTAWCQIERTLYKFRAKPHCRICYSPDRPMDSCLYVPADLEYGIITYEELFCNCKHKAGEYKNKKSKCQHCKCELAAAPSITPAQGLFGGSETVLFRGNSKVFNMWCCGHDTSLLTSAGIMDIESAINNKVDATYGMYGQKAIINTLQKDECYTNTIETHLGYSIQCTPEHGLYCLTPRGPEWKEAGQIAIDDYLGIQFDTNYYVDSDEINIVLTESGGWQPPSHITQELAYIIGLYISEGSWSYGKFLIYNTDEEVVSRLVSNTLGLNFIPEPKYDRISLCNKRFIELLEKLGFNHVNHASEKYISQRLLQCSEAVIKSMISGMFDGDGHSSRHNGTVGYTSTSEKLIAQLRMLLLNAGMLSKISHDERPTSNFGGVVREHNPDGSWQLLLATRDSKVFYDTIGFRIPRKQNKQKRLKDSREQIFGLHNSIANLYRNHGCGKLPYEAMRTLFVHSDYVLSSLIHKVRSWDEYQDDVDYNYVMARLDERTRDRNKIIWLPVRRVSDSRARVCEVSIDSNDHSYLANGFISHNSQIARTVILAFVKKEGRDKKNASTYRDHLTTRVTINEDRLQRFFSEADDLCQYSDDHMVCLEALQHIVQTDDKPYDGLIGKLVERSGLSRTQVTLFIKMMRFRAQEFSDSPINREINRDKLSYGYQESE